MHGMHTARVDQEPTEVFGCKILVYENDLDLIAGWVLEQPNHETGGDLFGFWTHSGAPAVQLVLGPGPRACHNVAAFFQDADYLRHAGLHAQERHGLQHIGEWHSHHRLSLAHPSSGDVATLRYLFQHTAFPRFLLCIATIRDMPARSQPRPPPTGILRKTVHGVRSFYGSTRDRRQGSTRVEIGAFMFERGKPGYERGLWVVLPGASPLGDAVRRSGNLATADEPNHAWHVPQTTLADSPAVRKAPPAGWYTQPWGAAFLRHLDALCREAFDDCGISLGTDTNELSYRFRTMHGELQLRFPKGFPESGALLLSPDGEIGEVTAESGEDGGPFFACLKRLAAVPVEPTSDNESACVDEGITNELEQHATEKAATGESNFAAVLPNVGMAQSDGSREDLP